MAIVATVVNQQTIQFDVPASAGGTATRVFITTGIAQFGLGVGSSGQFVQQTQSVKLLVDPVITPGQFRKATGIVGLANFAHADANAAGQNVSAAWRIEDIATSQDDESGKVELRFEATVGISGQNASAQLFAVTFQVTSIAAI